jgi:hypothetical protein
MNDCRMDGARSLIVPGRPSGVPAPGSRRLTPANDAAVVVAFGPLRRAGGALARMTSIAQAEGL